MKFSSSTLSALSLSTGAWFAEGKEPISRYQILPAGNGTAASPYGVVLSLEPLNGKFFVEAHKQTLSSSGSPITVELFANVEANASCVNGTLIANSTGNIISTDYYEFQNAPAGYTPTTSDGVIGVAEFSIQNFRGADIGIFTDTSPTSVPNATSGVPNATSSPGCDVVCPGNRPTIPQSYFKRLVQLCANGGECPGSVISVNCWDTSTVTNMDMGFPMVHFNEPLNCWDTSSVTSMDYMFGKSSFNQPIDSWDVSSVTSTKQMFWLAKFNQPIAAWDVSKVETMQDMFGYADFNQCLSSWKDKTRDDVVVLDMFKQNNHCDKNVGPWCQKACSSGRKLDSKSVPSGTISLCARASIRMDIDGKQGEYVSFVDSHMKVSVDLAGTFETFTQNVSIAATNAFMQETNITKSVDVESFLCGTDGINNGKPVSDRYKIGQDFKVCVRPTAAYTSKYSVVSFKNVICGYRKLVTESGVSTDILTEVTVNLTGSTDAAGNATGTSAAAFTSVITSGYFDGGKDVFTCGGEAVLNFNGRRLTTGFSHVSLDNEDSFRALQETTNGRGDSPFATTIGLLSDSDDVDGLAAPAFTASHGGWSFLLIMGTVVVMAGVL